MRGGVSLAVWIGGAVSEIECLRRAGGPPDGERRAPGSPGNQPTGLDGSAPAPVSARSTIYRALLDLAGYGNVLVDVLSGASAGGLNGAVYTAAQVHRFDMAALRDLWIRLGDIEALSRATTSAGRAKESLLADAEDQRGCPAPLVAPRWRRLLLPHPLAPPRSPDRRGATLAG
jgi:hypothetical protein